METFEKAMGQKDTPAWQVPAGPNASLIIGVMNNDVGAIKQAIENGEDINARSATDLLGGQGTPLFVAATKGYEAAAKVLLEAGADADGSQHPLFFAAGYGHVGIIKALLEAGATVDAEHRKRQTPLHMASYDGELEAAKLLLAAGADPSLKGGYDNNTPVEAARLRKNHEFADYVQAVMDDPANRPTPESVGLDIRKRAATLRALGRPLGAFTEGELRRANREAQRQEALRGGGI